MRTVVAEGGEGSKIGALKREVEHTGGQQVPQVTMLVFVDLEEPLLAITRSAPLRQRYPGG